MAGYLPGRPSRAAGQGTSAAHRLSPPCWPSGQTGGRSLLDVAEGLGADLARTALPRPVALDRHLDAGDFCVIASASPQRCRGGGPGLGGPAAVARGRGVRRALPGRLEGPFCHGRGKVAGSGSSWGRPISPGSAYSDSMSDLPLLSAAGARWPSPRTSRLRREPPARRAGRPHLPSPDRHRAPRRPRRDSGCRTGPSRKSQPRAPRRARGSGGVRGRPPAPSAVTAGGESRRSAHAALLPRRGTVRTLAAMGQGRQRRSSLPSVFHPAHLLTAGPCGSA